MSRTTLIRVTEITFATIMIILNVLAHMGYVWAETLFGWGMLGLILAMLLLALGGLVILMETPLPTWKRRK